MQSNNTMQKLAIQNWLSYQSQTLSESLLLKIVFSPFPSNTQSFSLSLSARRRSEHPYMDTACLVKKMCLRGQYRISANTMPPQWTGAKSSTRRSNLKQPQGGHTPALTTLIVTLCTTQSALFSPPPDSKLSEACAARPRRRWCGQIH